MGARGMPSTMLPIVPRAASLPLSSTIRTSKPGMGLPAEPGLMTRGLWTSVLVWFLPAAAVNAMPEMGEPDSEDHQLSMTWAPGAQYFSRRV